jgi:hypothetical protein
MTYFVNKNALTIIYLFYYLYKKLNKMNGQKNLKVKNDFFNGIERE